VARVAAAAERRKSQRRIADNTIEDAIADLLALAEMNADLRQYLLRVGAIEAIVDEFEVG
jgi:hypothetical protein